MSKKIGTAVAKDIVSNTFDDLNKKSIKEKNEILNLDNVSTHTILELKTLLLSLEKKSSEI